MVINVAKEFSGTPGGRYSRGGKFSGEDFRRNLLLPRFHECMENGEKLTVVLDGGYGYASSFLEEAFGGLVRETKDARTRQIEIISAEQPGLIDTIKGYINDAINRLPDT